nr:hypothetical protein [Candidatus Sigynarchaeota archaeon]
MAESASKMNRHNSSMAVTAANFPRYNSTRFQAMEQAWQEMVAQDRRRHKYFK